MGGTVRIDTDFGKMRKKLERAFTLANRITDEPLKGEMVSVLHAIETEAANRAARTDLEAALHSGPTGANQYPYQGPINTLRGQR